MEKRWWLVLLLLLLLLLVAVLVAVQLTSALQSNNLRLMLN